MDACMRIPHAQVQGLLNPPLPAPNPPTCTWGMQALTHMQWNTSSRSAMPLSWKRPSEWATTGWKLDEAPRPPVPLYAALDPCEPGGHGVQQYICTNVGRHDMTAATPGGHGGPLCPFNQSPLGP